LKRIFQSRRDMMSLVSAGSAVHIPLPALRLADGAEDHYIATVLNERV
jgi:hypothetical protein